MNCQYSRYFNLKLRYPAIFLSRHENRSTIAPTSFQNNHSTTHWKNCFFENTGALKKKKKYGAVYLTLFDNSRTTMSSKTEIEITLTQHETNTVSR